MSYECVETRGGRHKSHRRGRMTHFLHCVIQPFPPLPSPSPWGRAETRRVEESQKSLWVSRQISHEGVADSFLRNACIFLGRKKNEIVSPPRVFFFWGGWAEHFSFRLWLTVFTTAAGEEWLQQFVFQAIPRFFKPNAQIIERYMTALTAKVTFGCRETRYIQLGQLSL